MTRLFTFWSSDDEIRIVGIEATDKPLHDLDLALESLGNELKWNLVDAIVCK